MVDLFRAIKPCLFWICASIFVSSPTIAEPVDSVLALAGTKIAVVLDTPVNTASLQKGMQIASHVKDDLMTQTGLQIPKNAVLSGSITAIERRKGVDTCTLRFDKLTLPDGRVGKLVAAPLVRKWQVDILHDTNHHLLAAEDLGGETRIWGKSGRTLVPLVLEKADVFTIELKDPIVLSER